MQLKLKQSNCLKDYLSAAIQLLSKPNCHNHHKKELRFYRKTQPKVRCLNDVHKESNKLLDFSKSIDFVLIIL